MTTTEATTQEVITYDLQIRLQVDVPTEALKAYGDDPEALRDDEILDIIGEDTDRVPDALAAMFERMDFTTSYVDVDVWQGPHEAPKAEPVRFYKPDEGEPYTLPIPNMISGNVRFTENGIEAVEESPLNKFNDDQLLGAYEAARRIWGLRGMHRYQREQMAEYLSELQWGMLARPTLHTFKAQDGIAESVRQPCVYCGQPQDAHEKKEAE